MVANDLGARSWHKSHNWYRREVDGIPMEAAMHHIASYSTEDDPDCEFILQYRGFRARKDLRMYRIATDYAEYGDLDGLLKLYTPHGDPRKFLKDPNSDLAMAMEWEVLPRLPLRLAVELFKALIQGCKHMTKRGIVHRDLKPNNILLGKPGPESDFYERGVKPLISDFGLAVPSNPLSTRTPTT
jgi:serine/threonine protein kinase